MKKLFLVILCVGVMAVSLSESAFAYSAADIVDRSGGVYTNPDSFTGEYLFTVMDNQVIVDDFIVEQINLKIEPDVLGLDFYGKDNTSGTDQDGLGITVETFDEGYNGTWQTDNGDFINFYTVKSANEWALYWIEGDGANSGLWTTDHLLTPNERNTPDISHLSLYTSTAVIPEPSTVFLLGIGLLGILGLGRKFKK